MAGWALPVVLDFVCDLQCIVRTKSHYTNMGGWWNQKELAGNCLFMEELGDSAPGRDLLSDARMQRQPLYLFLAVLLGGCHCLGISLFLCCDCTYSLNSLNVLSTFLNHTTCDCCLNINPGAHPFHLSSDASGGICLRTFPLVVHIPFLALWRHRVILGILSSGCSSSEKAGKFSFKNQ